MMDLNVKHWEMKSQATEFEKRLANHTPGKRQLCRIYIELAKLNCKKLNNPFRIMFERHKETYHHRGYTDSS